MFGVTPLVCHQVKPAAEGGGSALKTRVVGNSASSLSLLEMDYSVLWPQRFYSSGCGGVPFCLHLVFSRRIEGSHCHDNHRRSRRDTWMG